MKYLLILTFFLLSLNNFSQNIDQNLRYLSSVSKYSLLVDSFSSLQSSTLQKTYKAYDWYEERQQQKIERKLFKREIKLIEANNTHYNYSMPYFNMYNNPYFPFGIYYPFNNRLYK